MPVPRGESEVTSMLALLVDDVELFKLDRGPKRSYIACYAVLGIIGPACRAAGVSRTTAQTWRREDETFRRCEKLAKSFSVDLLEEEATKRGWIGYLEPVYGRLPGKDAGTGVVGYRRRFSDQLLLAVLAANRPERFGRSRVEHTGADGGPIEISAARERLKARLDQLRKRKAELEAGVAPQERE